MPLPLVEPPNAPAIVRVDQPAHRVEIDYHGKRLFSGRLSPGTSVETQSQDADGKVTQTLTLTGPSPSLDGTLTVSDQAFAAETLGPQQARFPVVRNSDGPSFNLRNNAVYDRRQDLVFSGPPDGGTEVLPLGKGRFRFHASGQSVKLVFRPRFYQRHKNITFFEPWKRDVRRDSMAGWCSWWAYRDGIDEKAVLRVTDAFAKNLKPFGYDTIQLDDGYESAEGAPTDYWLKTNSKFPSGLDGLARSIGAKGMRPGIWVGTQIFDDTVANAHPDWFVRDPDGKPHKGPWIGYGVDGSNPVALSTLFRPVFSAFRRDGFGYVKIDSLRHLLYDALYPCRDQMLKEGVTPEAAFRDYLSAARQELGNRTYLLACWGVLPEAVGIADACRLGTDGFGPSTMLQYNSWNNVVWRNDPDHVDISPEGEDIIRPTLVSMAGVQLLLSDRADFYEQGTRLEGAKRAAPIPFTRPGQLYDFDPTKTDNLIKGLRNRNGGSNPGPIDADQRGPECPYWQLDVGRPFENWTVLARLSWHELPEREVSFSDLGLSDGRYAVYEFWTGHYLGDFTGRFPTPAQAAKAARVYSIRRVLNHPQVISTSRHLTQGGPDLLNVQWDEATSTLRGRSLVVAGDPYAITIRLADRQVESASHSLANQGSSTAVLRLTPDRPGAVDWWIKFKPVLR